ncbi:MAG: hypothetical protein HY280_00975 [Nitrospinae bacterium]|nr:hypothetical protein [Nitrospinota bacterium]
MFVILCAVAGLASCGQGEALRKKVETAENRSAAMESKMASLEKLVGAINVKDDYDLAERCGKQASSAFKSLFGEKQESATFTNHYNKKLNKCFVMVVNKITVGRKTKKELSRAVSIFDINENKEYGYYLKNAKDEAPKCSFLEKPCESEKDWDALTAPFMGE